MLDLINEHDGPSLTDMKGEVIMPKISEDIILKCSKEKAFSKMVNLDFFKNILIYD
jgi:hypothetical protein